MADIKLKVSTTKTYHCTISQEELLVILNRLNALAHKLPANTEVTITVPSGGDYSGDELHLNEVGGLSLTWSETEVKGTL